MIGNSLTEFNFSLIATIQTLQIYGDISKDCIPLGNYIHQTCTMALRPLMKLTLQSIDSNDTYIGHLYLHNLSSPLGGDASPLQLWSWEDYGPFPKGHDRAPRGAPDPLGASYYVIAVVLVYGMSIVLLLASHINRKNAKALEDSRQINKYLQEFQVWIQTDKKAGRQTGRSISTYRSSR